MQRLSLSHTLGWSTKGVRHRAAERGGGLGTLEEDSLPRTASPAILVCLPVACYRPAVTPLPLRTCAPRRALRPLPARLGPPPAGPPRRWPGRHVAARRPWRRRARGAAAKGAAARRSGDVGRGMRAHGHGYRHNIFKGWVGVGRCCAGPAATGAARQAITCLAWGMIRYIASDRARVPACPRSGAIPLPLPSPSPPVAVKGGEWEGRGRGITPVHERQRGRAPCHSQCKCCSTLFPTLICSSSSRSLAFFMLLTAMRSRCVSRYMLKSSSARSGSLGNGGREKGVRHGVKLVSVVLLVVLQRSHAQVLSQCSAFRHAQGQRMQEEVLGLGPGPRAPPNEKSARTAWRAEGGGPSETLAREDEALRHTGREAAPGRPSLSWHASTPTRRPHTLRQLTRPAGRCPPCHAQGRHNPSRSWHPLTANPPFRHPPLPPHPSGRSMPIMRPVS